jgi:hypothetical protein
MKVPAEPHRQPATRLRTLLEKPGAAVLRRNQIAEAPDSDDPLLRNRIRIAAVLSVDLSDPPHESDPAAAGSSQKPEAAAPQPDVSDPFSTSLAKGLEIWFSDGDRAACVLADSDEIPSALALFDAYLRLARFQPAFERLDQRLVGIHYLFREGLSIGIQGSPAEHPSAAGSFFESVAAIPEIDDFRQPCFTVRLPQEALVFFHDRLRSASTWLDDNSYPSILGSR